MPYAMKENPALRWALFQITPAHLVHLVNLVPPKAKHPATSVYLENTAQALTSQYAQTVKQENTTKYLASQAHAPAVMLENTMQIREPRCQVHVHHVLQEVMVPAQA